jgi:hypothetical protein
VVLILAGYDSPIPIGLEMMRKGEDEVGCALRLLNRVVHDLGVRFLDIVIGDALYCIPRFFDECEKLHIYPGAVLKDNQENLLETAISLKKKTVPVIKEEHDDEKLELWAPQKNMWVKPTWKVTKTINNNYFQTILKASEFEIKFILTYWGLIGFDFGFLVLSTAQASIKLACEKISRQPFSGEFFELLTGSGFRNIFFKPPIRKINVSFRPANPLHEGRLIIHLSPYFPMVR